MELWDGKEVVPMKTFPAAACGSDGGAFILRQMIRNILVHATLKTVNATVSKLTGLGCTQLREYTLLSFQLLDEAIQSGEAKMHAS